MSNRLVSVVIVTKGANDYLKPCLDSLQKQTYSALEVIVIDNSLNQNFSQKISKSYPKIQLYPSLEGLSYCEAMNKGINLSKGSFVLCLNDDVVLDGAFIEKALKGFSIDNRIGMVSGKILRQDAIIIDSTGLFLSLQRTPKERGYNSKDRGQFDKEEYIFGASGAAAFYNREMLEEIKLASDYFDADYHYFYEDLDIAWRVKRLGWKGYYIPKALAFHVRGGTARAGYGINKPYARRYISDNLHLDLLKNRYLTLIKNESILGFILHLPFILAYDILIWLYILAFRPRLIKGFFLNVKYLNSAFKKRRLTEALQGILKKGAE